MKTHLQGKWHSVAHVPTAMVLFYLFTLPGTSLWTKSILSWSQALSVIWHRLNLWQGLC